MKTKLLLFFLLFSNYGFSQWSADPNVNTLLTSGVDRYTRPISVSDGVGGIITVFAEAIYNPLTHTETRRLYAQKLSTAGILQWAGNGIRLSATTNNITDHIVVADGSGGVVAVWMEEMVNGSDQTQIYAQRINNAGNVMWGSNGVAVNTAVTEYELADIIRDGSGKYIFSYSDASIQKNFAQRLSSDGVLEWGTGTQLVDPTAVGDHTSALVSLDGNGYKFIWQEEYSVGGNKGARYHWQKINADGTRNGSNFLMDDYAPHPTNKHGIEGATSDGSGGYYFTTIGNDGTIAKLYLQHLLGNGTKSYTQTPWGMEIASSIGKIITEGNVSVLDYGVSAAADGVGGVVIGWTANRAGIDGMFAQRFSATGAKLWGPSDVTVATGFFSKYFYDEHIKMNTEGDFMFWISKPSMIHGEHSYIQKISASGVPQFASPGVLASGRDSYKYGDMVVSGNKVVLVWEDLALNNQSSRIFAQSVFSSGALPVKFSAFNAVYTNGITKVTWSTASETNNDYFDIERSEDGITFVSIGTQRGLIKSDQIKSYAFTDINAISTSGFLYYRIKQVDRNSLFDYTDIKAVKVPKLNAFTVKSFPNPVINKLTIALAQEGAVGTYSIADISGKARLKGSFINNKTVDVVSLPVGVYILHVRYGENVYREKILKN